MIGLTTILILFGLMLLILGYTTETLDTNVKIVSVCMIITGSLLGIIWWQSPPINIYTKIETSYDYKKNTYSLQLKECQLKQDHVSVCSIKSNITIPKDTFELFYNKHVVAKEVN